MKFESREGARRYLSTLLATCAYNAAALLIATSKEPAVAPEPELVDSLTHDVEEAMAILGDVEVGPWPATIASARADGIEVLRVLSEIRIRVHSEAVSQLEKPIANLLDAFRIEPPFRVLLESIRTAGHTG